MPPFIPSAEDEAIALQKSQDMRKRLDLLGQRERDILSLAYDQDYSAREIAEELGLEYDNVRQIMARSRKFVTSQ
jgi:RNA polymerase sigma factor (sigma-70 family)